MQADKYIYIIVSKTHTRLGKFIRKRLNVNYNHSSICFNDDFSEIYSFGRKEINKFYYAGFVDEAKDEGFFRHFPESNVAVIQIKVTDEQFSSASNKIENFKHKEDFYKYNLLGLMYCYFGISVKRPNKYFCSEFVAEVLSDANILDCDKCETLIRPHDFIDIYSNNVIYQGEIGELLKT